MTSRKLSLASNLNCTSAERPLRPQHKDHHIPFPSKFHPSLHFHQVSFFVLSSHIFLAVMDARSKVRQSSMFARFAQCHRPNQGKSAGSFFSPLQLEKKTHGFSQVRGDSCPHSLSFRSQASTVSRDIASVVGREVGFSKQPVEPVELSQLSFSSQSSVIEYHESSSPTMMQYSQNYPPLHQNSSSSNDSLNSSCYNRGQQNRFAGHRSKTKQQVKESEELSHNNSSTHNSANTSAGSTSIHARLLQSKGGPKSKLWQRMTPRRIGTSTAPLLQIPGQHSMSKRQSSLQSNLFLQQKARQNSTPSVASRAKRSSSLSSSSSEITDIEERTNENQRLSHLQSELKAFVDKSMESIREKSTEFDRKKRQLEEESKNLQKEQDKVFQGRLHELKDDFDSKAANLNQLFDEKKSHLENESRSWIQRVGKAGNSQVQRLSDYSHATLTKFHGAAKATESLLRAYKETHTDAIQALPDMIRQMLSQVMNAVLPSISTEATLADTTVSASCKANSASRKSRSIGRKSSIPTAKIETGIRESTTKRCRASSSCSGMGQSQITAGTGSNKRLRRSKRIRDTTDKENLTPPSKPGRTRPCVTPAEATNEENVPSMDVDILSPIPKKSLVRRGRKDISTRGDKKRKILSGKSSVTPLNSVPSEVEFSNIQESSPLTQVSGHHQSLRNISRPKGSTLKRDKRRKSYGRARTPKKPLSTNYMSDDTFSFASDGIKH